MAIKFVYYGQCKYKSALTNVDHSLLCFCHLRIFFTGKGKKDDDWSDEDSDVELNEVSEDEFAKPVSKKKSKLGSY